MSMQQTTNADTTPYASAPVLGPAPVPAPSSAQLIKLKLAAHAIEPELRVAVPRDYRRFELLSFLLPLNLNRRKAHLRRMGRAVPAVITEIEVLESDRGVRVVFNYESASNPQTIDHVTLSLDQAAPLGLQRGETFTLLVDPKDEHDVLPYFLVRVPAKPLALSLPRPRRNRPRANASSGRIAAVPGVEAELYCAAPRHVVWTPATTRARIWLANAVALIGFALYWTCQAGMGSFETVLGAAYALALTLILWGVLESKWRRSRFFLEYGNAVPATVHKLSMQQGDNGMMTQMGCLYTHPGGRSQSHTVALSAVQVTAIGGLALGSKFTLLCHPKWGEEPMPYFAIRGAEIPGARPAQTTPPAIP